MSTPESLNASAALLSASTLMTWPLLFSSISKGPSARMIDRRGREVLSMQLRLPPAEVARNLEHVVHETGGAAHVQVRVGIWWADHGSGVQHLLLRPVIDMNVHLRGVGSA
jgi:hypothetical protein